MEFIFDQEIPNSGQFLISAEWDQLFNKTNSSI